MNSVCKMTGNEVVLPCSNAGCPLFGDCLVSYEKGTAKPTTNADHIRSMTDEELVNVVPCPLGFSMFRCTAEKPCGICKREWLKQPYKEDA